MSMLNTPHKDQLMSDLRLVVADAEALLKSGANDASEAANGLGMALKSRLADARTGLQGLQTSAVDRASAAGHVADDYVHAHPWHSMAIGAGVGVIVGLLIGRR
jgi:ElaB/YqjD/DUF883 family membrane-anchored ribosome-binding protein